MTFNKINMPPKRSGRNIHRFLIKESYRIFKDRGYSLEIEKNLCDKKDSRVKYKADVLATKDGKRIAIECLTRPTLRTAKDKQKYREHCDGLILVYPYTFVPTFPTEYFFDESIEVEIPNKIIEIKEDKISIPVSLETRKRVNLAKYKLGCETQDAIINKVFDIVEKITEASK